jgi:hypothetical protein
MILSNFVSTIYLVLDLVFRCNIQSPLVDFLIKRFNRHLVQIEKKKLIKKRSNGVDFENFHFYLIYVT